MNPSGATTLSADTGALLAILASALIAALGYVGKLAVQAFKDRRTETARRRARLLELKALLWAGRTAFLVQRDLAHRLAAELKEAYRSDLPGVAGYERLFAEFHDRFTPDQTELHGVIRAYTAYALQPINKAVADWLRTDFVYRTPLGKTEPEMQLAMMLNKLDAHLVLWLAKYEGWIPNQPNHALVYLADEEHHGLGFPKGIEEAVDAVLAKHRS